jgi:hypothetical protein
MDHEALQTNGNTASTSEERQARAEWLIAELRRRAAACDNPHEQANLQRSADSLLRLATAFRS